jgi:hypothetical protein
VVSVVLGVDVDSQNATAVALDAGSDVAAGSGDTQI